MQGYLTRDGMPPAEFLAEGRRELRRYGGRVVADDRVTADCRTAPGSSTSRWRAAGRCTAAADRRGDGPRRRAARACPACRRALGPRRAALPVLPRLGGAGPALRRDRFGADRDPPGAPGHPVVEGRDALPAHRAGAADEDWEKLAAAGVTVVEGEVAGLEIEDDRLVGVRLASGQEFPRSALFVDAKPVPRHGLLNELGAAMQDTPVGPYPAVDPTGRTSVPGVWAVGNATGPKVQVIHAAAAGYQAGDSDQLRAGPHGHRNGRGTAPRGDFHAGDGGRGLRTRAGRRPPRSALRPIVRRASIPVQPWSFDTEGGIDAAMTDETGGPPPGLPAPPPPGVSALPAAPTTGRSSWSPVAARGWARRSRRSSRGSGPIWSSPAARRSG